MFRAVTGQRRISALIAIAAFLVAAGAVGPSSASAEKEALC